MKSYNVHERKTVLYIMIYKGEKLSSEMSIWFRYNEEKIIKVDGKIMKDLE